MERKKELCEGKASFNGYCENVSEDKLSARHPIFNKKEVKPILKHETPTPKQIKLWLETQFGTLKKAARVGSISESRLHQIFMGYKIPKNPDILKRLSEVWNIDIVILTKVFERLGR